jgi:DNA-binding NtrC family response regulator
MPEPRRLLLVEDDASNRLTLGALLEDEGFVVEAAATLAEARELLRSAPAFTVVLLDRRLGQEDGLALVPVVREAAPAAKVVVLSGADTDAPGVDATLRKGGSFDALAAALAAILGGA